MDPFFKNRFIQHKFCGVGVSIREKGTIFRNIQNIGSSYNSIFVSRRFLTIYGALMLLIYYLWPKTKMLRVTKRIRTLIVVYDNRMTYVFYTTSVINRSFTSFLKLRIDVIW